MAQFGDSACRRPAAIFLNGACNRFGGWARLMPMQFDFAGFYRALNARRENLEISWRQVSHEAGVGKSTLARMSRMRRPDADGLAALSAWAKLNPADYVKLPSRPRPRR
jgi:hypothetical protein